MKRLVIVSVIALSVFSGALAAHGSVGLGVQAGYVEPTGITAKFWLGGQSAIDMAVGWSLSRYNGYLAAQAGYLYHFPIATGGRGTLAPYLGVGGLIGISDNLNLAARIPLGLEFIYSPISFYAQLDPLLNLIPATEFGLAAGIGLRFYF
jgi:hypothetical protein